MDMPAELIRQIDLRVIASYVTMGDKTVEDWPDISQQDLLGYVKSSGKLAKTSAANPTDYEDWFRKLAEEGKPVVHIAKSSGISSFPKKRSSYDSSSIRGSPLTISAVKKALITCAASPLLQTILWLWKIPRNFWSTKKR